jgi:hypothetical protein
MAKKTTAKKAAKKMRNIRKPRLIEGLPVYDAPPDMVMSFQVKDSDVKKSRKNDPANCAAAVAIKREYDTDVMVHISRTYIKSPDKKHWIRFHTPESIAREITSFDRGHSFETGEYYVRPEPESARLGVYRGANKERTTGNKRPRGKIHRTARVREHAAKK